jgi:hypothetical protein
MVSVSDAGLQAHVGKCTIAVVVEEVIWLAFKPSRPTAHGDSAVLAERDQGRVGPGFRRMCDVVVDVTGYEEIKTAVAVVVAETGACGPVAESDSGLFGNVREGSVVVIAVETILAEVGDVEVGPAVIVEVCDRNAEPPSVVGDASFSRDIGEGTVVIVVKERSVGWSGFSGESVVSGAVDQVDVEPAVVVVVEQGDSGADLFENVRLRGCPHHVTPMIQPSLLRDVFKDDGTGFYQAARGDRTLFGVEHRSKLTCRCRSPLLRIRRSCRRDADLRLHKTSEQKSNRSEGQDPDPGGFRRNSAHAWHKVNPASCRSMVPGESAERL